MFGRELECDGYDVLLVLDREQDERVRFLIALRTG